MKNARVVVVENHESTRELLRDMLGKMGISVLAEAEAGEQAGKLILKEKPDLVILDISGPRLDGFDVLEQVWEGGFTGAILVLTSDERPYVVHRIRKHLHITGAVSKKAGQAVWREGILAVLSNKPYFCTLFKKLEIKQKHNQDSPGKLLTKREIEVLQFIGLAESDEKIGRRLKIAPATARRFRRSLLHKLNLPDRVGLVRFSQEKGYACFALLNRTASVVVPFLSLAMPFLLQGMDDGLPDLA